MQQINRHWGLLCVALSLQANLLVASCLPTTAASASWSTDYAAGEDYLSDQQLPQAEASFRKALKEVQQNGHSVDDEAKCSARLADALALRGKTDMAQALYRKALTSLEQHYGKESKKIVPALLRLGSMYESEGDPTTAIAMYKRAMSINERNYGPYSPAVANSLRRLGRATYGAGDKREAAKNYKAALSILMQEPGLSASNQMEGLLKDYHDLLRTSDNSNKDLLIDFRRDMRDDRDSTEDPTANSNTQPSQNLTAPSKPTTGTTSTTPIRDAQKSLAGAPTPFGFTPPDVHEKQSGSDASTKEPNNALTVQPETSIRTTPMLPASASQTDSPAPKLRPEHSAFENLIQKSANPSSVMTTGAPPQNLDEPQSPLSVPLTQTLAAASRPSGSLWQKQSAYQLNASKQGQTNEDPQVLQRGFGQPFSQSQLAPMYKVMDDVIYQQNHYQESELLDQRKIAIDLKALGPNHPSVGNDLNALALLYVSQHRYKDAEPLLMRALKIYENSYGNENILVIKAQATLASVEYYLGNIEQAAQLYRTALSNGISTLSNKDLQTARILNELAFLYFQQGKLQEAATFYEWALASTQGAVGDENPLFAACMKDYAQLLRALGRPAEATALDMRADGILAQK
jgi:tetratricopeptide (TPR) repeat protein